MFGSKYYVQIACPAINVYIPRFDLSKRNGRIRKENRLTN